MIPQPAYRWTVRHVRREPVTTRAGLAVYHVLMESWPEIENGREHWERFAFLMEAPPREGPAIMRRVLARNLPRLSSAEVFARACCLGSIEFAHVKALEGAEPSKIVPA